MRYLFLFIFTYYLSACDSIPESTMVSTGSLTFNDSLISYTYSVKVYEDEVHYTLHDQKYTVSKELWEFTDMIKFTVFLKAVEENNNTRLIMPKRGLISKNAEFHLISACDDELYLINSGWTHRIKKAIPFPRIMDELGYDNISLSRAAIFSAFEWRKVQDSELSNYTINHLTGHCTEPCTGLKKSWFYPISPYGQALSKIKSIDNLKDIYHFDIIKDYFLDIQKVKIKPEDKYSFNFYLDLSEKLLQLDDKSLNQVFILLDTINTHYPEHKLYDISCDDEHVSLHELVKDVWELPELVKNKNRYAHLYLKLNDEYCTSDWPVWKTRWLNPYTRLLHFIHRGLKEGKDRQLISSNREGIELAIKKVKYSLNQ